MKRLQALIDKNSEHKIKKAIGEAESRTSAEIVPMVVWESSPTFHVRPILFLCLALLSSVLFPLLHMDLFFPLLPWHLAALCFLIVLGLAHWGAKQPFVQNFLTPDQFEEAHVSQRALLEFHHAQMDQTLAKTGVLLFVSIRERRAVVIADKAISDKVPKETWSEVIRCLTTTAKKLNITDGIVEAILLAGKKLSPVFPKHANDKNELPDKLILKL
jgi:putative membrane protein